MSHYRIPLRVERSHLRKGVSYDDLKGLLAMVQCIFHLPDCPRRDFYTIESQSEGTLFRPDYSPTGHAHGVKMLQELLLTKSFNTNKLWLTLNKVVIARRSRSNLDVGDLQSTIQN